jgi:hypothetical protein
LTTVRAEPSLSPELPIERLGTLAALMGLTMQPRILRQKLTPQFLTAREFVLQQGSSFAFGAVALVVARTQHTQSSAKTLTSAV